MSILPVLFLAGIAGLSVSVLAFCKKNEGRSYLYFAISIFVLSVVALHLFFEGNKILPAVPFLRALLHSMIFMVAPASYLFVWKKNESSQNSRGILLHFLPAPVFLFLFLILPQQHFFTNASASFFSPGSFFGINMLISLIWVLYVYTQWLGVQSQPGFGVIKLYSAAMLLLFMCVFVENAGIVSQIVLVRNVILAFLLISSLFFYIKEVLLYEEKIPETETSETLEIEKEPAIETVTGFTLSNEQIRIYSRKIEQVMLRQPFLKHGLSIRDLAEITEIPAHHLSFTINSNYGLHFQDFINQRRIDYLKEQLHCKEWQNLSLEGLGWSVGFKSRTTFFRAFVKLTGETPSEYIRAARKQRKQSLNASA